MDRRAHSYWSFYWPLSLVGVIWLTGRFAQNRVLMGYPDGVAELAVYALALGVFGPFRMTMAFAPHMVNVQVRGPRSARSTLQFLLGASVLVTLPVAALAWTPLGPRLLGLLYRVPADHIAIMVRYLRWFSPLIPLLALSHYCMGLLVQARRTGIVTVLTMVHVVVTLAVLAVGVWRRWDPVVTLAGSVLAAQLAYLAAAAVCLAALHEHADPERDRPLSMREMAAFFLPMAGTTFLFAWSRPIIFAFLTALNPDGRPGLPSGEEMVAAVALAATFTMIFQAAVNQFRHMFASFGRARAEGVRRFMVRTTGVLTGLMVLALATGLARLFFRYVQNATGPTLVMATQALWPLCLSPFAICLRNYYHGLAMVHRRTAGMMVGSVMRNVSIFVGALALFRAGWYNHVSAALLLPISFAAEGVVAALFVRRLPEEVQARGGGPPETAGGTT